MEGILLSKFVLFIVSEWDSESINNYVLSVYSMAGIGEASVDETETHPVSWDSPPEEGIRQRTTFY